MLPVLFSLALATNWQVLLLANLQQPAFSDTNNVMYATTLFFFLILIFIFLRNGVNLAISQAAVSGWLGSNDTLSLLAVVDDGCADGNFTAMQHAALALNPHAQTAVSFLILDRSPFFTFVFAR